MRYATPRVQPPSTMRCAPHPPRKNQRRTTSSFGTVDVGLCLFARLSSKTSFFIASSTDGHLPHDVIDVARAAALAADDDAMREDVDGGALQIGGHRMIATVEHRDRHRHAKPHERR